MNIVIGLASMAACASMFLVCAAQLREIIVLAWEMARNSRVAPPARAAARGGFAQERWRAGACGAVFLQADGRLVSSGV